MARKIQLDAKGNEWFSWGLGWRLKWNRVVKYKQRRQLVVKNLLGLESNLRVGACTALSTSWIKAYRDNPKQTPSKRIESFNSDDDFKEHDKTALAFNTAKYSGNNLAEQYADRIANFSVDKMGAEKEDVKKRTHPIPPPLVDFDSTVSFLDNNKGHYFLMMPISNSKSSHVCALHAGSEGMRFFDPNFGEFKIKNSDRGAFFLNLKNQYETYIDLKGEANVLEFNTGWVLVGVEKK